jgi:membrane protease YdiL (CAAX protease family)
MKQKIFLIAQISLVYFLIFVQYPVGVLLSRLVLHQELEYVLQPSYLLVWGLVRILIILPLLFNILNYYDGQKELFLQMGSKNRMFAFAFWGAFLFSITGILLYPVFLKQTALNAFNLLYLLPFFFLYAVSNSFSEELFFRGISLTVFSKKLPFALANILQALFFALIHLTTPARMSSNLMTFVVLTFFLGLFWGYSTKKSKSLIPAIIMHMIADIFVAIALF